MRARRHPFAIPFGPAAVLAALLVAACLTAAPLRAQTIVNQATGQINGVALDPALGTVTLTRQALAGVSSIAEITPDRVQARNTAVPFTIDVRPAIGPTDPAVTRIVIDVPADYANLAITGFDVNGAPLVSACPTPATGQYCGTVSGSRLTLDLGDPITSGPVSLSVHFLADAPMVAVTDTFACAIEAAGGATPSAPGNADGNVSNGNRLAVDAWSSIDPALSTLTVNPPGVPADGVAFSTVTATLRDAAGLPVPGKLIVLSSSRGGLDTFVQPPAPTDSAGVAIGRVRSTTSGIAQIIADDVTDTVTIAAQPQVTFSIGQVLVLDKSADRAVAGMGEAVGYVVTVRNNTAQPVTGFQLVDTPPAGLKYLAGTTLMGGATATDPVTGAVLSFAIDSLPALVDGNGNLVADPDEPGYLELRYRMVVGATADPGAHVNAVVARDACCNLSNTATATIEVAPDPLVQRGTIVGRVFADPDRDGRQIAGEAGLGQVRVTLDDGTMATTDEHGLYHFPAVRPGQRLVKLDTGSLSMPGRVTNREAQIVTVSPGLLAKVNFGVAAEADTERTGSPGVPGLRLASAWAVLPLDVRGSAGEHRSLVVNGRAVPLVEIPGAGAAAGPYVRIDGADVALQPGGRFRLGIQKDAADSVIVEMRGDRGAAVRGSVRPPRLELTSPSGEVRIPFAGSRDGYRVLANRPDSGAATLATDEPLVTREMLAECPIVGRTDPGNTVLLDGRSIRVDAHGEFRAVAPVTLGDNTFGLVLRAPSGVTRLANLVVNVAERDEQGGPMMGVTPVTPLEVAFPPRGRLLTSPRLRIAGTTAPGNRVRVNGDSVAVRPNGAFETVVALVSGPNTVRVTATDASGGSPATLERQVEYDADRLFLVAFADGVVGNLKGGGHLEGTGGSGSPGFYAQGRVAYVLKGRILGKYLVSSAFDSRERQFRDFFDGLNAGERDRVFTNLDPDKLYPVYGDASLVTYDGTSDGRFYLAVEGEELNVTVGNALLALDGGGDLATFRRSVYGGRVQYRSAARTRFGDPTTMVTLVGAEARHAHVRDALAGTGGSVFYLSAGRVVEGSEQVSLVVRDKSSGLAVTRIPQRRGLDYHIKSDEARVMFERPVPSTVPDGWVVDRSVMAGNPVSVEVEYETDLGPLKSSSVAAQLQRRLGDHYGLGVTYVSDELGTGRYEMSGVNGEVRLSRSSRLTAEYAMSQGAGSRAFASLDGGLTYSEVPLAGTGRGDAWGASLELDAAELLGWRRSAVVGGYARRVDDEFVSSGTLSERGADRFGGHLRAEFGGAGTVAARFDREQRTGALATGATTDRGSLSWMREAPRWGVGTEVQHASAHDSSGVASSSSSLGAARAWYRVAHNLTTQLEQQATLAGARNDRSTLSLVYQMLPSLALEGAASDGTLGRSLRGGATLRVGDGSAYVRRNLQDGAIRSDATVIGAQVPVGARSRAYAERQWQTTAGAPRDQGLVGLEQRWEPRQGVELSTSGEYTALDTDRGEARRSAVGASAHYTRATLDLSSQAELRVETGAYDRIQVVTGHRASATLAGGLTALAYYRRGTTRDRQLDRIEARFEEGSVGLAFRPLAQDRYTVLARVGRLSDLRPTGSPAPSGPGSAATIDVATVEGSVQLFSGVEWVGKQALRFVRDEPLGGPEVRTQSLLGISRLNLKLIGPVGLGTEYRLLTQREAADHRSGWLNELHWDAAERLRLAAGHNFADFSDDEFSRNDRSVRGWFVRLQGRY